MECLSLKEVYQECLKTEQGDRREAVIATLSLWYGAGFDIMETVPREALISQMLTKITKER